MKMLYSFKGQAPQPLPERIRLSNGLTRTDRSTFTQEEISDAGYVLIEENPPSITWSQNISWNGAQWIVENKTESEVVQLRQNEWIKIREKRNVKLQETDWIIIRQLERGEKADEAILQYRQALRDITLQTDPFNLQWPVNPLGNNQSNTVPNA